PEPATRREHSSRTPTAMARETISSSARSPPSSQYLLFDDHPASTMPYTPSDPKARMYRNPTGRLATTMSTSPHGVGSGAANGITANVSSAGMNDMAGASMKSTLSAWAGSVSSFTRFLRPSAAGWSNPWGPTRFGPRR